jgi:urease accessory protein UreE
MTGLVLLVLAAAVAFLSQQILRLRSDLSAEIQASRETLALVAKQEAGIRSLLGEVAGTLGAVPHAANALAAPQSFTLLEHSLRALIDEMGVTRKKISGVFEQIQGDLAATVKHHEASVEALNSGGDVFVKNLTAATSLLASVSEGLQQTTRVSLDLHEALRTNAVSFDMVQELIVALTQLLPQFRDTTQGFSRLLGMAEERNMFSEKTFLRFEESLTRLSRSAEDFSAVARTLTSSLDAGAVQIDVTEADLTPASGADAVRA